MIIVCWKNLYHILNLQRQTHNKDVKPISYTNGNKVWLNSKYIKTKKNRKLEGKFFKVFQVLYPIGIETYKVKLLKKWRIHNVFYLSLLEQKTTKKDQVDQNITELKATGNSKKYKLEAIWNSSLYANQEKSYLLGFYCLVV